jgi:hypothetical protein
MNLICIFAKYLNNYASFNHKKFQSTYKDNDVKRLENYKSKVPATVENN